MSATAVSSNSITQREFWKRLLARPADYPWFCRLFLVFWSGYLFFYGMGGAELWRTESLRALIAQGMLDSGNWVVPKLYGEALFTKPPGMYVAIALCSLPWGMVTEWTARLPSALAASVTVILFYRLFGRYFGRPAGLVAAVVLPMSVIYLDKAPAAEIDMLHLAWVAGAHYCLFRVLEVEEEKGAGANRWSKLGWWLGALLCVAGGALTKWVAPLFFYATAVSLLWQRGKLRMLWSWQHVVSAALGLALCLSWAAAALALENDRVFFNTLRDQSVPRLIPFYDAHYQMRHNYWWGTVLHPGLILASALPWAVVALWSLRRGFSQIWDERGRRLLAFLHCWTWPTLVLWSFFPDHAVRHRFPMFPGLSGLAVMVWIAWSTGKWPLPWPRIRPHRFLTVTLFAWLAVKLVFVEAIMPIRNAEKEPRAKGHLLASLIPAGITLYLFQLKDEGIMFYYGGKVVRLQSPAQLPSPGEPVYCILNYSEWQVWRNRRKMEVLRHLLDEQGDPIVLVRVTG